MTPAKQSPKGYRGQRGIPGPPGPAGKTGAEGLKGDTGRRGIEGPRGLTGLAGAMGAIGPAGRVGNLNDVAKQLSYVDRSIENIYNEMGTHIDRMTQLQRELDTLRETVRNLVSATPLKGPARTRS